MVSSQAAKLHSPSGILSVLGFNVVTQLPRVQYFSKQLQLCVPSILPAMKQMSEGYQPSA